MRTEPTTAQGRVLEICVDDPLSLAAAVAGGADRIELCSALAMGGLTPSPAFVAQAVKTGLPVHAMVRPRAGDFRYDADEIALMSDEIVRLREMGVAGVVVGAADDERRLNERALARFRDAANGIVLVLHRVIDLAPDPCSAVCLAATLGFDFVLTSGGAPRAFEGRALIRRMAEAASAGLTVIAGAGITPENAATLIRETGVSQLHASASEPIAWRDRRVAEWGFASGPRRATNPARVAALKAAMAAS